MNSTLELKLRKLAQKLEHPVRVLAGLFGGIGLLGLGWMSGAAASYVVSAVALTGVFLVVCIWFPRMVSRSRLVPFLLCGVGMVALAGVVYSKLQLEHAREYFPGKLIVAQVFVLIAYLVSAIATRPAEES